MILVLCPLQDQRRVPRPHQGGGGHRATISVLRGMGSPSQINHICGFLASPPGNMVSSTARAEYVPTSPEIKIMGCHTSVNI